MTDATTLHPGSLGDRLKRDTWDLHQRAENAEIPRLLIAGRASRELYLDLLGRSLPLHAALDAAIESLRPSSEALAALVGIDRLQAPRIEADLRACGVDPASLAPRGSAADAAGTPSADGEHAAWRLLGMHYVREGATNGNRFIATRLKHAWGIDEHETGGLSFLDPYGVDQPRHWKAFKDSLNTLEPRPAEADACVLGARRMFEAVMLIHDDCGRAMAASGGSS